MPHLVQVPTSQGSLGKNEGCEKAPHAIVEQWKPMGEVEEIQVVSSNFEETNAAIERRAGELFGEGEKALFLGGDHSITFPLFRAFSASYPGAGLVVLDAHADCAQLLDPPSHEDYIHTLIAQKILKPEHLLMLGVRKVYEEERPFLEQHRIHYFGVREVRNGEAIRALRDFTQNIGHLYVSLDIDVLDASIAPATGYPEQSGLQVSEAAALLEVLGESGKVRAADLAEVNPLLEGGTQTVRAAAELAGQLFRIL